MGKGTARVKPAAPAPARGRGRPRTTAPGSQPVFTSLGPEALAELDALAAAERRARAPMVAILIEEALAARRKSK